MSRACSFAALALALALCSCRGAAAPAETRTLEIRVARDDAVKLGVVSVRIDDDPLVATEADGVRRLEVASARGRVRVRVECPAGFRPAEARTVDLRNGAHGAPLRLSFMCRPVQRKVALAVLAPGAEGHAVIVDGEPIGAVGADATFHALLERPPGSTMRLAVDPGGLLLDAATADVALADRDELVMLTPTLRPHVAAPRRRAKRRVPAPDLHVPYAIRRPHG
jgi:hypothetical protein